MIRLLLAYLFSAIVGTYVSGLFFHVTGIMDTWPWDASLSEIMLWPFYGYGPVVYMTLAIVAVMLLMVVGTPLLYELGRKNVHDVWRTSLWGAGISAFLTHMLLLLIVFLDQTWADVFSLSNLILSAVAGAVYTGLAWTIIRSKNRPL